MAIKKDIFFIKELTHMQQLEPLSEDAIHSLNIPILENNRAKGIKGGTVFKTILQEANVCNKNKRIYKKEGIEAALKEEAPRIASGVLMGELDHPAASDPARFSQVKLQDVCFRVLDTNWDGNVLHGIGETLGTSKGKDMQALIIENGMMLGFSLRALGKTQINPTTGIAEVLSPMRLITYDCVSNPSHANAIMSEVITESALLKMVTNDSHKDMLLSNEEQLQTIAEGYGFNMEYLLKEEKVAINKRNGTAIMALDNKSIEVFLEENTLNNFVNIAKKYFI